MSAEACQTAYDGDVPALKTLLTNPATRAAIDQLFKVPGIGGKTTVLCCAAVGRSSEAVAVVLAAGANVNTQDSIGYTPLHCAVNGDHPAAVTQLLSTMECDLELRTQNGNTALALGESLGKTACVALLKKYAADPAAF
eukprot:gene18629-biopygen7523